jgi:uncharacterized lipoprotein YmbA
MRSLIALALAAGLAACASAPKESYYTLAAVVPASSAPGPLAEAGITVVASGLVEAVDRPQLVTRVSDARVQILEQQRWAEPLKSAIPRVVAVNLGRLLGSARVTAQSQTPSGPTAYRVALDVQRFESLPGEGVALEVAWTLRREGAADTRVGRSSIREKATAGGYEGLVAAHSRALATVSREIAESLAAFAR